MFAGVKSLYYSCVYYVVEKYRHYYPQLHLLPPRIQSDICQERNKRANKVHHIVASYNYVTPFTVINYVQSSINLGRIIIEYFRKELPDHKR